MPGSAAPVHTRIMPMQKAPPTSPGTALAVRWWLHNAAGPPRPGLAPRAGQGSLQRCESHFSATVGSQLTAHMWSCALVVRRDRDSTLRPRVRRARAGGARWGCVHEVAATAMQSNQGVPALGSTRDSTAHPPRHGFFWTMNTCFIRCRQTRTRWAPRSSSHRTWRAKEQRAERRRRRTSQSAKRRQWACGASRWACQCNRWTRRDWAR